MTQTELLYQLESDLRSVLEDVRNNLVPLPEQHLTHRPDALDWNALECIAHLNVFLDYYLPRVELSIHKAKARRWKGGGDVVYRGRGARIIRKVTSDKKYKTGKKYNLANLPLGTEVVKRFLINNEMLLRSLQAAKDININKPRIRKLNAWTASYSLANVMELLIRHSQRHVAQAKRAAEHDPEGLK